MSSSPTNQISPAQSPNPPQPEGASASAADHDFTDPTFFAPPLGGEKYFNYFRRLHKALKPKNYLEIGIRNGASLALAECPVIGIDPEFDLQSNVLNNKPVSHVFRCSSDFFFETYDPRSLLGRPISLAFLDGMHLFEFLLRDFYNTEKYCESDSIIILHDCLPSDLGMTRRERGILTEPTRKASWWTGDVWKLLPILRKYRPSLKLLPLDASPTGLVLVAGLDPKDRTLQDHYDQIISESQKLELKDIGVKEFILSQEVKSTRSFSTRENIMEWLLS